MEVFVFVVRDGAGSWELPVEMYEAFLAAFKTLDVDTELRKAQAWSMANTKRRKTCKGMPRFLNQWLNSAARQKLGVGQGGRYGSQQRTVQEAIDRGVVHFGSGTAQGAKKVRPRGVDQEAGKQKGGGQGWP